MYALHIMRIMTVHLHTLLAVINRVDEFYKRVNGL